MNRFAKLLVTVGTALCFVGRLHATGYFGPSIYLEDGGKNVEGSPEFYWSLEVRRISRDFHPPEKLVVPKEADQINEAKEPEERTKKTSDNTTETDLKDFDSAVQEARIKPADPAKAKGQHKQARAALDATASGTPTPLPVEFDSEFAQYHKGAAAYLNQQWAEARAAWENLLKRPEQDRHYRTVWAAFMLGKVALKEKDFPKAAEWFQRARELAKAGFGDSLGLAAESYGWEGRAEWKQDHPETAAPLFMNQLALGDYSAVVSLKALIPDREPVDGMLNYGPESEDWQSWNDEQKRVEEEKEISKLKAAARNPLLRRLVTVHILATASTPDLYADQTGNKPVNRCARWLNVIRDLKPGQLDDAEYLGWVAYNNGDYKGAAHWLELSKGNSGAALWLKAKLQLRAGKFADATNTMARAIEIMKTSPGYTEEWTTGDLFAQGEHWGFASTASGDLGGLQLARGDFVQALDVLLKGHLWEDAAFVAERVLTANELKQYVDALPQTEPPKQGEDYNQKLRYLLGRRLVREDRYDDAKQYLPPPHDKILEKYVKALNDGANEKLSKTVRAHAWFTAAWLARYDGMELMGTEGAPDAYAEGGSFEMPDLAKERRTGAYQTIAYDKKGEASYDENGNPKMKSAPAFLKASAKEVQRLNANKISPDIRFHYRLIAGALAMKAAALLSDNSEELADVVNTAGLWVKDRDEKTGNRYMQTIERRGSKTKLGRAAIAKHWFVDQQGPWSTAEQEAYQAMHKELGIESSE
jgi:tetratricopeptide (TPR) repeat protein